MTTPAPSLAQTLLLAVAVCALAGCTSGSTVRHVVQDFGNVGAGVSASVSYDESGPGFNDDEMWGRESLMEDAYTACEGHAITVEFRPPSGIGWNPHGYGYIFGCTNGSQSWNRPYFLREGEKPKRLSYCGHTGKQIIPCFYPAKYDTFHATDGPYEVRR